MWPFFYFLVTYLLKVFQFYDYQNNHALVSIHSFIKIASLLMISVIEERELKFYQSSKKKVNIWYLSKTHLCNEKKLKVRILRPYQIHNKCNQTCIDVWSFVYSTSCILNSKCSHFPKERKKDSNAVIKSNGISS